MKALAEIKTNKKIEHIHVAHPETEKYNEIVNELLKCEHFELEDLQPYNGTPDFEEHFSDKEIEDATYITVLIDVEGDLSAARNQGDGIVRKAIDALASRELDLLYAREYGRESFLYFNYEQRTQVDEAII